MRYLVYGLCASALIATTARAETITILMESVPDTQYVKTLVPDFEKATGITVNLEVVNYAEMHTKLVPQLVSRKGGYSAIVVDFYWVGEFIKAGWLQPLDERIGADHFDTAPYIPALMDLVGKVDGTTYMLPFYNYAMGLTYRTDLLADPANQKAYEVANNAPLRAPETWDEYRKQVAFFTKDGFNGVVNQGLRPDPIAMEWSNYLFANGGSFHDANWKSTLNSPEAKAALDQYIESIDKYGPLGSASFSFDEAFNVMAQGKAYSYITYNFFRTSLDNPSQSSVVGKAEIMPVPGVTPETSGSLNGAWGWGIPKSSPNPDAAWKFLSWVESFPIAKARALQGGAPTRSDVFDDAEVLAKYPYYRDLKRLLERSHNFPTFTYTPQFVEILGRELSLAVAKEKTSEAALATIASEFDALALKDGKQK
ncbi:ABC transporter substrate-binding protein [Rhodospirillum rubrum]|uniref:ABC transporter substrate-binding protein n=2 Tax=Rhodospirillum rubrum TaxID=1085 RepID=UPI001908E0E4|nr:sugar ABC transporter substrate-binding protein [Rhodospirillum rubrum]MBK1663043.1 ABC transporter substrate-binding protein [Rhodospirillum rubrum]MBK1678302.1 ABC transporter substrate-binding protein [Rhodospirillum rubrum]